MDSAPNESHLLAAMAASERRAFTELYSTHLAGVQRYIFLFTRCQELAQELTQQVFIGLWERREKLADVTNFRSYLYRAAKNLVFDEIRRQQRQVSAHAHVYATADTCLLPADSALIHQQDHEVAQALINQLSVKRREIFLLRTQQELSLDEIAQQLNISKSVVKKQFYAAVSFVKKNLLAARQTVVPMSGLWLLLHVFGW